MSWDIYGNPLRRGHCEVHPQVHEEYPCSVCMAERNYNQQQPSYEIERLNYELDQQNDYIKALKSERDSLAAQVEYLCYLITRVALCYENNTGNEPSLSVFHRALDEAQESIEKTPSQCLREIQAESIEKFFVEFESESYWDKTVKDVIYEGYEYAAKVRQGGE